MKHIGEKICMMNISNIKFLFDTNIFIYSLDNESPFHEISKHLITEVILGRRLGVIAQQNLLECTNVLFRKSENSYQEIFSQIQTFAFDSNFEIITPQTSTVETFLVLAKKIKERKEQFFDLYLAATMLDNDLHHIVTANDKDFADIPGITSYNPWKK